VSGNGIQNPLRGTVTAMVTSFDTSGELDLEGCRSVARHLVAHGSSGLVVGGTTGESPTLDDREKLDLLEAVLDEVDGAVPVALGTGSNDTRHSAALTRLAAEAGAAAGLVVTPYYNRPNRSGIEAHFTAIAEAAPDLPLILYNIPSRVVTNMPPDLLADLGGLPNVVAVKQANDEEMGPVEGIELLAGNDSGLLACLDAGGVGGILVASHLVGDRMADLIEAHQAGDRDRAVAIDASLAAAYEAMSVTTNPIPVKAALEMAGICGGTLRLPMVEATPAEKDRIRSLLGEAGVELP
jgi:4-hydroxy-tetrahydrodipicolinate synthase